MSGKRIDEETIREIVYILLHLVPVGRVTTYKSLATVTGQHPRKIARILAENKDLITTPCHRVVREDRDLSGYSLGRDFKKRLLKIEGVSIERDKVSRESITRLEELLLSKDP